MAHAPAPASPQMSAPHRPTVGQLLRRRREQLGLTLAAVAHQVDATKGYLSMIENGRVANPPSKALIVRLEAALGITDGALQRAAAWQSTPEPVKQELTTAADEARTGRDLARWLRDAAAEGRSLDQLLQTGELRQAISSALGEPAGDGAGDGSVDLLPARRSLRIPLINKVAAGYPTGFTDLDYPARVADEYVTAPDVEDPDAFAATVCGESMLPEYKAGDVVVFAPAADVVDGCDCFVRLEPDHETTFKRVYFDLEAGTIRLQPLNPAYPAAVVRREDVAGLYRAVGRYSRL